MRSGNMKGAFSSRWIASRAELGSNRGPHPLPPERAVRYTLLIAQAVHYATPGCLHRDLKPGNVLVDKEDRPTSPILAWPRKSRAARSDAVRAILGTPSYMSPEQAACRRKMIRPTSDVYSLERFSMTCSPDVPFPGGQPGRNHAAGDRAGARALRLLNAKVHRDLETICLKCLSKDPARRYDSPNCSPKTSRDSYATNPFSRAAPAARTNYRWAKRHRPWPRWELPRGHVRARWSDRPFFRIGTRAIAWKWLEDGEGLAYDLYLIGATVSEVARKEGLVDAVSRNQNMPKHLQLDRERNEVLRILSGLLSNNPLVLEVENWLLLGTNGQILANHTKLRPP